MHYSLHIYKNSAVKFYKNMATGEGICVMQTDGQTGGQREKVQIY